MNDILLCALPLFLCSLAFGQPDPSDVGKEKHTSATLSQGVFFPDTPANAVCYFLDAASVANETAIGLVVQGAPVEKFGSNAWGAAMRRELPLQMQQFQQWREIVDSLVTEMQSENDATVSLTLHAEVPVGDADIKDLRTATVHFHLHRDPGNKTLLGSGGKDVWRLIPPSIETLIDKGAYDVDPLQRVMGLALHDPRWLPVLNQEENMMSLKLLCLGTIQFLQNNNWKYAFDDTEYEAAIKGYVRSDKPFMILGSNGEQWHFNNNLSQTTFPQPPFPHRPESARTVLFYDGTAPEPDKVNFRFNGKTPIAFADGSVKALTKDQLGDLIWQP